MRRNVWLMYAAYCLLVASEWLLPSSSRLIRALIFAAVGIVAAILNGGSRWRGFGDVGRLAVAAVLLVAVPEVLWGWGLRHVSSNLLAVVQALMPVVLVLVVAQSTGDSARRLLIPAVAGLGGMLLIVPLDIPASLVGRLSLVVLILSVVMIAVASVWIYRLLQRFSLVQGVAVFCLANALVLLVRGLFDQAGWGLSGWEWVAVGIEEGEAMLLVVLLRAVAPVRFGARYLAIPLLALVEGYVLLRPDLTLRMGFGVAVVAGSAAFLLLSRGADDGAGLSLR